MVYTVTLNPALDYNLFSTRFLPGEINRYSRAEYHPGGKGVNVSLLLTSLGVRNRALGICAGFTGGEIVRMMQEQGCETDFVRLDGPQCHSRINVKIFSPAGEETGLNGDGPDIPPEAAAQLMEKLSALGDGDVLVLAGSIPKSMGNGAYGEILRAVDPAVLTVVDAAGGALRAALPFRPFLLKPNAEELGELFGVEIQDMGMAKEYAMQLIRSGARNVAVSMGDQGALLAEEGGRCLFCRTARGKTVSTVGAGDSFVAGFLYGMGLHGSMEGALRWGVAAGAATAFSPGIASGEQVKALYPQVGNPHPL